MLRKGMTIFGKHKQKARKMGDFQDCTFYVPVRRSIRFLLSLHQRDTRTGRRTLEPQITSCSRGCRPDGRHQAVGKTQQDVLELKEGVLDPLSDITEVENSEDDPDAVEEVQEVVPTVCSYCGSENHSSSICAKRSIANGAYGRWVIPSVGCNVAAYSCNWDADQSYVQEITDSSDSAAFLTCGGVGVLADHNDQGFCGLSNISVGAKAYMDFGDGATYYECYQVEYGHNTGEKMLDGNGNIMSYSNYSSGTVICYTCLDHWTNIYITYWTPV